MGEFLVSLTMGNHQHPPSLFTLRFFLRWSFLSKIYFFQQFKRKSVLLSIEKAFSSWYDYISKEL